MPDAGSKSSQRRLMVMLVAAVVAVAGIGVLTGIQPDRYEAKRPPPRQPRVMGDVPPARSHAELERLGWPGAPADQAWRAGEGKARLAAVDRTELGEGVEMAVDDRARWRAYDGAPPVVPHPVRSGGAPECLACHLEGFALGGRRASLIPHATFASCTQCHVSSASVVAVSAGIGPQLGESTWLGLASPTEGATVWTGAPPAVPHSTWMRERCESCHGPDGRAALRTPHPERLSCLQCHPAISEHGPPGAR